jgi:predicted transcriptional regulator YheO
MSRKCHPLLKPLVPVVRLLGSMLGRECEILLHDVSRGEPFIVAIENGELTGRDLDAPMTDLGHFLMTSPEAESVEFLANYPSEAGNGRAMRSGVAMIRDDNHALVGFLCINFDMTRGLMLKDMGTFLTTLRPLSFSGFQAERFPGVNDGSASEILEKARQDFGKPLRYLDREERIKCIRWLEEQGFFKLKGAVPLLTKEMGKSRYTLYADIRAIRNGLGEERE